MISPKAVDRSWTKPVWKYFHRLNRCIARAMTESNSWNNVMQDAVIYGTGIYTPRQQEADAKRIGQLMRGLKP